MKRNLVSIISIVILLVIVSILIFCCSPKKLQKNDEKINVIATIFPNYDFAKQVGGEKVNVKLLLGAGVESHTYEPTPKDMIEINDSDLFIYTGSNFEPWAKNILDSSEKDFKIVDTSKNIELIEREEFEKRSINSEILVGEEEHNHDEEVHDAHGYETDSFDSHIWLSPTNAIIMIDDILAKLCEIDSENSEYYIKNAENYKKQILNLDSNFSKMIETSKRAEIAFAGEFSYTYFIDKYKLKFISVYNNCGHGEDPSISKVKSVIDYINTHNIPVVFYEELSEGTVAKMIGDETEAKASVFYTIHNANVKEDTYISLMEKNYESLKQALN